MLHVFDFRLHADPARVALRPFHLGWQAKHAPGARAAQLVDDIAALSEESAMREYERVLQDFQGRHWQIEQIFSTRFAEVARNLHLDATSFSTSRQRLVGAYFCHEYTFAAAALMNPSIVPHPDQSGMAAGAVRFIMSLRAVGEGHISSVAFREGIAEPDGGFELWPEAAFATAMELDHESHARSQGPVRISRHPESSLSNSVIFPITEQQRNGLEDLRLVRFEHEAGEYEWIGTYTAYSGSSIRSELLRTRNFREFDLMPIEGEAGRNKGMALFPEKIDGRYAMVGRQDGKNLYLLYSDDLDTWDNDGQLLMEPEYPWEFIQIGNCGSPIRTDDGWLLFTHGVGPMRKYSLGCALLDLKEPGRVLARSSEPVLTAENADRSGYVPNVIYTCGALKVGERLLIPYGVSDSAVGFATCLIDDLIDQLRAAPATNRSIVA